MTRVHTGVPGVRAREPLQPPGALALGYLATPNYYYESGTGIVSDTEYTALPRPSARQPGR
eukprot:966476-Rhodomonas_salina.2